MPWHTSRVHASLLWQSIEQERNAMSKAQSAKVVSDLIASIYDCVLDHSRWHATLERINTAVRCKSSILYLFDRPRQTFSMMKITGVDELYWTKVIEKYGPDIQRFAMDDEAAGRSIDEPLLMSQMSRTVVDGSKYVQEVLRPAELIDVLSLHLLLTPMRVASLGMARHKSKGPIAKSDMGLAALLLPHLRRAVIITDVLDLRSIECARMTEALDAVRCGVLLIDAEGKILHLNGAAEELLGRNDAPIRVRRGKLSAKVPLAARELHKAIERATQDEASIDGTGVAIRLGDANRMPIFAHVLPLTGSHQRARLLPSAIAAVFIGLPSNGQDAATSVTVAFKLTAAEARVVNMLLGGSTLAATASSLGIAVTTAKSHLENIFAKTGVSRQTDLIRLASVLTPPTRSRYG